MVIGWMIIDIVMNLVEKEKNLVNECSSKIDILTLYGGVLNAHGYETFIYNVWGFLLFHNAYCRDIIKKEILATFEMSY